MGSTSMAAEQVVSAYATALFVRSEAEIKRPVVLLSGERTNIYGVLEKHMRETALPPSERFWRAVRTQWTPQLDTWRPRVNGVQLKVLSGARLPESEEEWQALHTALTSVRQHLRADTSVEALHAELRDFVGMVVDWWGNRKKAGEMGNLSSLGVGGLMKRVASAGMLLGSGALGMPLSKKQCLEFLPLPQPPPLQQQQQQQAPAGITTVYQSTIYSAPEIVPHHLLAGGGSGQLPDRVQLASSAELLAAAAAVASQPQPPRHHIQELRDPSNHGGGGYLAHLQSSLPSALPSALPGTADSQLFGPLFPGDRGDGGGADGGAASPRGGGEAGPRQASGHLPVAADAGAAGGSGQLNGYFPQSPQGDRHEGSADNREAARPAAPSASDSKCFVTLNVGGHRFLTTAATLAAVDGSYFAKLSRQAAAAAGRGRDSVEFFVDRSGKIFEYVLDYLRSQRFSDSASTLPRDERTLLLLAREAEFYQLPDLADRARSMLLALPAAAAPAAQQPALGLQQAAGEDTPSDMPANIAAAEGSAHGGLLLAGRFGANGSGLLPPVQPQQQQQQQQGSLLDAIFMETGFQDPGELPAVQAGLLQRLNAALQAKQADGFSLASYECGTEREGPLRNLHYHLLLRRAGP